MDPVLLEDTSFDVIIYGTGLIETYLSGALSLAGKKVLHLEENDYYGCSFATHSYSAFKDEIDNKINDPIQVTTMETLPPNSKLLPLTQRPNLIKNGSYVHFEHQSTENDNGEEKDDSKIESIEENLTKDSRRYNIDLHNNFLWCRGEDVENMVQSGTHRYIEFHCVRQTLISDNNGKLISAPVTKKDIFRSKDISLVEKRNLMRFVQTVMQNFDDNIETEEKLDVSKFESFKEFMVSQKLSDNLQSFILYIVCLCTSESESNEMSVKEGMERVKKYQQSSGVYGGSPFLYPLYGISEINQGYSRLGAVNGSIYILKRSVQSLVLDEESGKVKGVICNVGQYLEAPCFVSSAKYFPNANSSVSASRCITITNSSLVKDQELIHIVKPPSDNLNTIFINQLDSTTCVCPKGKYIVHFTTDSDKENPKEELETVVNTLLEETSNNVLFQSYFSLLGYDIDSENLPNGVHIAPDYSFTKIGFERHLKEAERQFNQIVGEDYPFYPKRPDPYENVNSE